MAEITISTLPGQYTEAEAVPVDNFLTLNVQLPPSKKIRVKVTTGTFQFAVGAAATAANPTFTTTDEAFTIELIGDAILWFQATAQADVFKIYNA